MSNPQLPASDASKAAEIRAAIRAMDAPAPPSSESSSDDEPEPEPAAGSGAGAGAGASAPSAAAAGADGEDCPEVPPGDRALESTRNELDSVRVDLLCDHPAKGMEAFAAPTVAKGAMCAWARSARPELTEVEVRDAGHGTGLGVAHVGQWMHAPESGTRTCAARRFAWLPRRLRGGVSVQLQAGHARMGRGCPDDVEPVAQFCTKGDCSVFVLVPQAIAAQGYLPPWLEAQGFELQPDCLVVASQGHDLPAAVAASGVFRGSSLDASAQDVFLVFECAHVGPRAGVPAGPRAWVMGKSGTGIPPKCSHDEVIGKASMYGVVVAPPSSGRLRKEV